MVQKPELPASEHFELEELATGVYAAIATEGGAAYSNAGIIDLGDQTLIFDTFDSPTAADDLKKAAEQLTGRTATYVIISHMHADHWCGNQVFGPQVPIIATRTTRADMPGGIEWLRQIKNDLAGLERDIEEEKENLKAETDPEKRAILEGYITRMKSWLVKLPDLEIRLPNQTFEGTLVFHGARRTAELVEVAPGHTNSDAYLLLPAERIMFAGDLGFFQCQPFMVYCRPLAWRAWLEQAQQFDVEVFVPGHGPLGTKADLSLMGQYITVVEETVARAIDKGLTAEEAVARTPPAPFDAWLHGSQRWEANVVSSYERQTGEPTD